MDQKIILNIEKRFLPVKKSKTFNRILDILDLREKKVLDLGCGNGEYLVNFGKDSLGITTTEEEVEYGKLKNFKIIKGNVENIDNLNINESFEAIWANNLFEHLLSPHAFLIKLRKLSTDNSFLVLGVPVVPFFSSLMNFSKFRGALAGSHINFFNKKSLQLTVERAGWKVKSIRPFVFANYFFDFVFGFLAPHLYVIANKNKGFKYPEKKLKEWKDDQNYKDLLNITEQC